MQAIFDFLIGMIVALATAALGHLGVDLQRRASEPQEIHRTVDCGQSGQAAAGNPSRDC